MAKEKTKDNLMEKVVSLCKRRGFVFPGSEIYGGLANTYDYGPLGVELKNNLKRAWWKKFVLDRPDILGLDGGIILNPKIWEASGHTQNFIDVLIECKSCHKRFRTDFLKEKSKCPECQGILAEPKKFVPMFKTFIGPAEDTSSVAYLRPETAQAIFANFKNVIDSFHPDLPFGIAQIGKAFRNEITMGNFIFRNLEFEQMEIEYFVRPEQWQEQFSLWQEAMLEWYLSLGIKKENLRWREHAQDELSHYSKKTLDLEYNFPFGGFKELCGLAYRTDYDLKNHSQKSGQDLSYADVGQKDRFFPHVVEPSFGLERALLAMLLEAYTEDKDRLVLRLSPEIAPYKVAVFPLLANKPDLVKKARQVFDLLRPNFHTAWDDRGNIGKRYYSQDEIGTVLGVTCDFQTMEDNTITVRHRDTMQQIRIPISTLKQTVQGVLDGEEFSGLGELVK